MLDKTMSIVGIAIAAFIVVLAFPVWYGFGNGAEASAPEVMVPAHASHCVESKQWMIANHPQLLEEWRNAVVRQGKKVYISKTYGTHYEMSLTNSCIQCHGNQATSCQQCHEYANVTLTCWDCHLGSTRNRP